MKPVPKGTNPIQLTGRLAGSAASLTRRVATMEPEAGEQVKFFRNWREWGRLRDSRFRPHD